MSESLVKPILESTDPLRILNQIATGWSGWHEPYKGRYFEGTYVPVALGYNKRPTNTYRESAVRRMNRPRFSCELVVNGKILVEGPGGIHVIPPGGLFTLVRPHTATYRAVSDKESDTFGSLWMTMDNPLLIDHMSRILMAPVLAIPEPTTSLIESFTLLYKVLHNGASGDYTEALTRSLSFYHALCESIVTSRKRSIRQMPPEDILLLEIREAFDPSIKVEGIADRLGFSREHLSRQFRKRHGVSPKHYLTRLRMEKLEQLVRSNHLSLEACSKDAGFTSYATASRAFRIKHGISMSEWRTQWASSISKKGP